MATEPTPTDAEIDALIAQHWPAFATAGAIPLTWLRNAFREGLARWDAQPAPAARPVPHVEPKPVARILLDSMGEPTTRPELLVDPELAEPDAFDAAYPHRAPHRIALLYPAAPSNPLSSTSKGA